MKKTHIVVATASQPSADTIMVTYYGGPDHGSVESITVRVNGPQVDDDQQFSFWKFSLSSTTRNSKKDKIAIVFLKKYVTFFTSYRVKYSHKMMIVCAKQNSSP